jgi:hypothetical protein
MWSPYLAYANRSNWKAVSQAYGMAAPSTKFKFFGNGIMCVDGTAAHSAYDPPESSAIPSYSF